VRLRSAFFSPPAVAGLALLAIVVGAAFGMRAFGGNAPETTQVAGNVIERSESPASIDPDEPAAEDPIVIPVPAPDRDEPETTDVEPQAQDAPAAPAPAPAGAPTVGIVRDTPPPAIPPATSTDDDAGQDEAPARPRPNRNPPASPRPTATPDEPTSPAPANPSPEPEDVALRTGEGHSRDTAIADNGDWLFREVNGHGSQTGDGSRAAQSRVVVAFNESAKQGTGAIRSFSCQAWVTAGEGRLTTDTNHFFEIALLAIDDNGNVIETVTSVFERHAYDLRPGQSTAATPMATNPLELDASDGVSYTCSVSYRDS
jgi:hypothetical protein